eukprot:2349818-Prymnesium_polylepis.1
MSCERAAAAAAAAARARQECVLCVLCVRAAAQTGRAEHASARARVPQRVHVCHSACTCATARA